MTTQKICSNCNTPLLCTTDNTCWCNQLPQILDPNPEVDCLCQACLLAAIASEVNANSKPQTVLQRTQIAALGTPPTPSEGQDFYMEEGLLVMTRWYLLRRGYCCDNGCRHCPYP